MEPHSNRSRKELYRLFLCTLLLSAQCVQAQTKWNAPKEADALKNPFSNTPAVLAEGKQLFVANCAPCHGMKGKGDGPAAVSLNPKPADHSSDAVQRESDGSIFWKLSEGHNPMPQFKQALSEDQRWKLVCYIRMLAKNPKKQ